jgi:uncharacterized protein (DUF433 family)
MQPKTIQSVIINRGRGPEIAGTRITVYDVLDYHKHGWHRDRIAALFRLSSRDIQAAIDYIEEHKSEVMADYERILERHRGYQYPPEVQAKIDESRRRARKRIEEIRGRRTDEASDAEDHG